MSFFFLGACLGILGVLLVVIFALLTLAQRGDAHLDQRLDITPTGLGLNHAPTERGEVLLSLSRTECGRECDRAG